MTLRDIPRPLDNGDITEGPSRDTKSRSRSGRWPIYSQDDAKISFTTKLALSQFNALQAHCFATQVSMAEFVREAVAEKLRRER